MIKIIEGGLSSPAHETIRREIREAVLDGKRVFLIVPEQQTLIAEVEMSEYLPESAPLFFEVTNFTRLANTVFRGLGGADAEYCDKTKKALLMWKAVTELSPTLTITGGRREVNAGTVERAMSAVMEMQSLGIDADALLSIEGAVSEGRLGAKVSDLARIMALYKKLLGEKYSDTADDISTMARKLRENPGFFDGARFYVEGFTSFTEPQYNLIGILSRLEDVTVHLTLPKAAQDAFEYTEIRRAKDRLLRAADLGGTDKKLVRIDGCTVQPFLAECCALLWRNSGKIDNISLQNKEELRIFETETPYDECDFIAADIRRRVAEGASYRDFAVIARRAESYVGIIDGAFETSRVPYFISKRTDTASFEAIKLIYTAFSVVLGGYRREDVISYAKCTPCKISRDECDEFELYTEKWQISGRRFCDGVVWNMNPDGYSATRAADCDERLCAIDATRRALITPLMNFEGRLGVAKTAKEKAHALVDFLVEIDLEGSINSRVLELIRLGETKAAEENRVLFPAICRALDTLVEVLGDAETTTDGFLAQLKVVFANADVGRIPAHYDAVTIGGADMIRLYDKKHIYLIGVRRGEFPPTVSEDSYFTDRDRLTLSSLGLALEGDIELRGARELYYFSRAFSYGKESVTITYSQKGINLKDAKRADVVGRLYDMTAGEIHAQRVADIKAWDLLYSPEATLSSLGKLDTGAYEAAKKALIESGRGDIVAVAERRISNTSLSLSRESRAALWKGPLALTQSRIDTYNKCPLSYFCKYQLSLLPEERAEFDAMSIGTFIHAILEGFFAGVVKDGVEISLLTDVDIVERTKREAVLYLERLDAGDSTRTKREEVLVDRLTRAAIPVVRGLCEEFSDCEFLPKFFELRIGRGREGMPEAAEFVAEDGERIFVHGVIDRVDTYTQNGRVYVRVVDYKTGKKVFSPTDIDKGENLQMFLYLKSIVETKNGKFLRELGVAEGEQPIPAGVIYVKTEVGDVRIDHPDKEEGERAIAAAQTRQGMLLDAPEVKNAMGTKFSPIKYTKSGAPDKRSAERLYSLEGWGELCQRMSDVVVDIAARMKSGDIGTATADADACKYCQFKPFCRGAKYK